MTVYEYLKMTNGDYDTYDTEFDTCVTCVDCSDSENEDNYYRFYSGIQKLVNVIEIKKDILIANWSEMIRKNKVILEEFMKERWIKQYEDEEDFIYEWIREFHLWGAGYASESTYKDFVENYMSKMEGV